MNEFSVWQALNDADLDALERRLDEANERERRLEVERRRPSPFPEMIAWLSARIAAA